MRNTMIRLVFETPAGARIELAVPAAGSVMQAAKTHAVPGIDADCGGSMVCGTCHAIVSPQWQQALPGQSEFERLILEGVPDTQPNTRLTCQIPITDALDGIVFRVPSRQR
jgi:ferredoxin, 2Fe-2S